MESEKNEAEFGFTRRRLIRVKTKLHFPSGFEFFLFVKIRKFRFLD